MMDKKLKAKWVKVLRSGKYKQGKGYLEKDNKFCCLGVLCKIVNPKAHTVERQWPTPHFLKKVGLSFKHTLDLSDKNDGGRAGTLAHHVKSVSFKRIATFIEKSEEL